MNTPRRRRTRGLCAPAPLESRIAPATFIVTSLLDDGSPETLRQKINATNNRPGADTIIFQIPAAQLPGTITLAGAAQMNIEDTLTIKGPGVDKLTISSASASRIIEIADGNDTISHPVAISGLTLRDGKTAGTGGAIHVGSAAVIQVSGSKFLENTARFRDGGALFYDSTGTSEIKTSILSGNVAGDEGGGIRNTGAGILTRIATVVTGNWAPSGPNIFP